MIGGGRRADGRRDVVVSRRDIGDHGAQHVERRVVADPAFPLHVHLNFVERNVARPFDHDLNAAPAATADEFAELVQFGELGFVAGIRQAAGAQPVAERHRHVVLEQIAMISSHRVKKGFSRRWWTIHFARMAPPRLTIPSLRFKAMGTSRLRMPA